MSARNPTLPERILTLLGASRVERSTTQMSRMFGQPPGRLAEALAKLERDGRIVRTGVSDCSGDRAGVPVWKINGKAEGRDD